MSLIKSIKSQLGLSVTPANNFTLDASAADGTMKLARGNAGATTQDILTVDAAGKVNFPQNSQTWQDVKASRAMATVYTNGTGQPITVCVSIISTATCNMYITVGALSILVVYVPNPQLGSGTFVVPAGATYKVEASSGTPTINTWVELR